MILGWNRRSDTKKLSVIELCTSTGIGKYVLILPGSGFLRDDPGLAVGHNDRDWMRKRRAM